MRHGAGAAGDVIISNRDLSGEAGWACTSLHTAIDVEKAVYYAVKILRAVEAR